MRLIAGQLHYRREDHSARTLCGLHLNGNIASRVAPNPVPSLPWPFHGRCWNCERVLFKQTKGTK